MTNIERNNQVLYKLFSNKFGSLMIQEPKGWNEDVKSYERDKDSRGIVSKIDIDLEFFGDGADYIRNVYYTLGIQEKVLLTKYEKNRYSLTEEWEIKYIQELDLGTFKEIERTGNVVVNSTEGGLYSDIKNRESDEYDLLENTSADGDDIGSLTTHPFQPLGRKIFVESKLQDERVNYQVFGFNTGNDSYNSRAIPLKVVYNSDKEDIVTPFDADEDFDASRNHQRIENSMGVGNTFFFQAEKDKTIKINLKSYSKLVSDNFNRREGGAKWMIQLNKGSQESGLLKIIEEETLFETLDFSLNQEVNLDIEREIFLNKGESLELVYTIFLKEAPLGNTSITRLEFNTNNTLIVEDITAYNEVLTISRCIKPLDFFDRLVSKITGKTGLVKSTIFEEGGEYEYIVLDNGLWARGFPDTYQDSSDEEQSIQLVTSFKDAFESFNYLEPLCWFTEVVGSTEYLRIEKAKDTQRNFIGISLGNVDQIEYESSKVDYFSKIEIGHDRGIEYEELNGLDETNGQSEYTTFISKNDSQYSAISKYRTDSTGYELTRRYPFSQFPKEDTKRDEDLWMHDAKNVNGVITHRVWQDIFDSQPIGIYDPDSAWNLFLSPANRLLYGHGYSIKRGLYHYPNNSIKFNSSNANQNLITEYNGYTLKESGSIKVSDIENPRIEATLVNFNFSLTQELEKKFNETTKINGIDVPNYFGLIEYLERGIKKYGRLVKLESSEKAQITLIKAKV